ncbi:hypothetical protein P7K49_005985 [Saguinus oedipus]|uniref:Uncharacterized protein n=1 Tax=Saguinus oedipus TaxID=9490 RepID=A0ABQ9W2R5_SAGOE|nr:hypothetical protein P7K49_005985 [Saguinus oedipus]
MDGTTHGAMASPSLSQELPVTVTATGAATPRSLDTSLQVLGTYQGAPSDTVEPASPAQASEQKQQPPPLLLRSRHSMRGTA